MTGCRDAKTDDVVRREEPRREGCSRNKSHRIGSVHHSTKLRKGDFSLNFILLVHLQLNNLLHYFGPGRHILVMHIYAIFSA